MIGRFLRTLAFKRRMSRDLRAIKAVRIARSEAAKRGQSTEIARRAERCRAMFPEIAR